MEILDELTISIIATLLGGVVGYWAAQRISKQNRVATLEAAKEKQILKTAQYLLDTGGIESVREIGCIVLYPNPGRKIPDSLRGHRDITILMLDVTQEDSPKASHVIFDYSSSKKDIGQSVEEALLDVSATFKLDDECKAQLREAEHGTPEGFVWVYTGMERRMLIIGILDREGWVYKRLLKTKAQLYIIRRKIRHARAKERKA